MTNQLVKGGERMAYWDCPKTYNVATKYVGHKFDYKDKQSIIDYHFRLFLNKTQSMFEWKGLPDTIQQRDMELLIQTNGSGIFIKNGENYFVLYGSLGGLWNQNYMPTIAIIHNPFIPQVDGAYKIYYGEESFKHIENNIKTVGDCVVIPNDPMFMGLEPIINNYANRLADTYISRRVVTIMSRYINVFVAKDNNTFKNIEEFLKKVEAGELGAILDEDKAHLFEDGNIYSLPMAANAGSSRMLTELIECEQYDKASFYNELGLQANYNMKRESINSNESQLNQDALFPFVDIMLESRRIACERINKVFGLEISVDFSSVWKLVREQIQASLEAEQNQAQESNSEEGNSEETNQLGNNEGEVNKDADGNIAGGDNSDNSDDSGNRKSES